MSLTAVQEYVSIGANRYTPASSWFQRSGVLAFGADQNVALWTPLSRQSVGIEQLLRGHKDRVTVVQFCAAYAAESSETLISGSADGKVLIWTSEDGGRVWLLKTEVDAHQGAVNSVATLSGSEYFVTGGADSKLKLWRIVGDEVNEVLTWEPKPRLIPLTLALGSFPNLSVQDAIFLVVGGTRNEVQIHVLKSLAHEPRAEKQATLTGHEGWTRSLCLKAVNERQLLLASASHDKYVRLWRFDLGDVRSTVANAATAESNSFEQTLTAKVQTVSAGECRYSITFEALLLGHEDWIYSVAWNPDSSTEQLLTASADGTLAIWELDPTSGIWISAFRLGEISGQKGATTATGSPGGFWTGMWSPDGQSVTCLGRTGSWRIWQFDHDQRYWVQRHGLGGHIMAANSLSWSLNGDYLLSTSSDQTTRLHAEWKRNLERTWHEFSRPQIHGYDLNCISATGNHQFASGADEKLLRVFNEPKDIAEMLEGLSEIKRPQDTSLPDTAAIPVLGLSNKAIEGDEDKVNAVNGDSREDEGYIAPSADMAISDIDAPPTEDLLARHTLWPEHEKLYGHGYEISESAYSDQSKILATACKASSIDHAVIRLYDTNTWDEIKPPLTAHSLTVTRLAWSQAPHNYLLSVGRDRQWFLFGRADNNNGTNPGWKLLQSNPKAHTRMILDAAWSPIGGKQFFATAGRDKTVKIWHCNSTQSPESGASFTEWSTIKRESPVTTVDFTSTRNKDVTVLAVGEDTGVLSIHFYNVENELSLIRSVNLAPSLCPSRAVTRIAWRPGDSAHETPDGGRHLAVAAADGSVRILTLNLEKLA